LKKENEYEEINHMRNKSHEYSSKNVSKRIFYNYFSLQKFHEIAKNFFRKLSIPEKFSITFKKII